MLVCAAHEPEPAFVGYGVATPDIPAHPTALERAQQSVDRALERLPEDVQATARVIEGSTASLAELAGVDLMVIGSRGYGALRQVLLGSVGPSWWALPSIPC